MTCEFDRRLRRRSKHIRKKKKTMLLTCIPWDLGRIQISVLACLPCRYCQAYQLPSGNGDVARRGPGTRSWKHSKTERRLHRTRRGIARGTGSGGRGPTISHRPPRRNYWRFPSPALPRVNSPDQQTLIIPIKIVEKKKKSPQRQKK